MNKFKNVGTLLKTKRKESNLTQVDVALAVGGLTIQSISNIERGVAGIPPKDFNLFCKIANISKEELKNAAIADYQAFIEQCLKEQP